MRLKDLVYRSALRRGAGEHEVGLPTGMGYQVFEVTNLTIPAGTDWSAHGGPSLGSFVISPHNMVQAKLSIEFAPGNRAQLTDVQDQIILQLDETGDYATSELGWYLSAQASGAGGNGGKGVKGDVVWGSAVDGLDLNNQVPDIVPPLLRGLGSDPIPDPFTLHVYVRTNAPTHHEAYIVRARAAFLVL